jgi:hypothetical protein
VVRLPWGPAISHHGSHSASLMPTAACDPWHAAAPGCAGRRPSPCACGTRGGVCERACSAGKCASRLVSVPPDLPWGRSPWHPRSQLQSTEEARAPPPRHPLVWEELGFHGRYPDTGWCHPAAELAGIAGAYRVAPTPSQSGRRVWLGSGSGLADGNQFCSRRLTCA